MTTWALIPVKHFAAAKTRLADAYSPEQRAALAKAMFEDTLDAVVHTSGIDRIAIATNDPDAHAIAEKVGALSVAEPSMGLNTALEVARLSLRKENASSIAIFPADIPAVRPEDIDILLGVAFGRSDDMLGGAIVPDNDQRGTNALLISAKADVPFSFGPDSFRKHLDVAAKEKVALRIMTLPHIATDCDFPGDITPLLAQSPGKRTTEILAKLARDRKPERRIAP